MSNKSHFREHYATLCDDELMHIATTRELVPEAIEAIKEELTRRGISDLSEYAAITAREAAADDVWRQEQITRRSQASGWKSKILYIGGVLSIAYGILRTIVPDKNAPGDGVLVVLGIGFLFFGWLMSKVEKYWTKNILFRAPPR